MALMNTIDHGIQIVKLLFQKLFLQGNLEINAPLVRYHISRTSRIKCGNNGKIVLGSVNLQTNVHLVAWGGILTVGEDCSFNRNAIVVARKQITIGNGTLIGPNVCIYDHDHAFGAKGMIREQMKYGTVIIGNNVWIGAGTIVLRGASIGDNCVIGAGCVVSGIIPENSIVTSGNRVLKIEPLH